MSNSSINNLNGKTNLFANFKIYGEINVSRRVREINNNLMSVNDVIINEISKLNDEFPYIKFELREEIFQSTVRVYAFNKIINSQDILNKLENRLQFMLNNLYEQNEYKVRIDLTGELKYIKYISKFRYLNNKDKIYWKITENNETKVGKITRFISKIKNRNL